MLVHCETVNHFSGTSEKGVQRIEVWYIRILVKNQFKKLNYLEQEILFRQTNFARERIKRLPQRCLVRGTLSSRV